MSEVDPLANESEAIGIALGWDFKCTSCGKVVEVGHLHGHPVWRDGVLGTDCVYREPACEHTGICDVWEGQVKCRDCGEIL